MKKKKKNRGFVRNLFSVLKEQYGSNRFILDSYFINVRNKQKKIFLIEPLKHNMCQTVLYFDQNLSETLKNATKIKNIHYIKDNMSQILLYPIQFLKWVNMGETILSVLSLS